LAIPVSIGSASNILTNIADTMMLGQYNEEHMVAASLGFQVFIIPFVLMMGITIGLTASMSKEIGQGVQPQTLTSAGIVYGILSAIVCAVLLFLSNHLSWFNPNPITVELAKPYLHWMAWSCLPVIIFLTLKQYFEAYELSILTTIVSLIVNLINIGLNSVFIFGGWGFEEMGAEGAGFATFISRILCIPLFIACITGIKKYREKIQQEHLIIDFKKIKELIQLGLPIGFQLFIEVTAFALAGIMTGFLGTDAQGAHQIAIQLAGFTFLLASGIGSASTVLAGQFYGEQNTNKLNELIKKTLLVILIYECSTAIILYITKSTIPHFYLNEEAESMIANTSILIAMAAIFQIPDGIQNIVHGLLRGMQDVKTPTFLSIAAHWVISLLGGYVLAFSFDLGIKGVWYGMISGLFFIAFTLLIRLRWTTRTLERKWRTKNTNFRDEHYSE